MAAPKVSVVMSVFNGERFLREAVDSILGQSFNDFEFIIVNDGSTDSTGELLSKYTTADSRVVLVQNKQNIGLTRSLNKGLRLAQGEFIARQDADDVSMAARLATQVEYLDNHPKIGLAGVLGFAIDARNRVTNALSLPTQDAEIRWALLFGNAFVHSGVMFRRRLVSEAGYYNTNLRYAQDYDYWTRFSEKCEVGNITQRLVCWRLTSRSVTETHFLEQQACADLTSMRQIAKLLDGCNAANERVRAPERMRGVRLLARHMLAELDPEAAFAAIEDIMLLLGQYLSESLANLSPRSRISHSIRRSARHVVLRAVGYYCVRWPRRVSVRMFAAFLRRDPYALLSPVAWRTMAKLVFRRGWPRWATYAFRWFRTHLLTQRYGKTVIGVQSILGNRDTGLVMDEEVPRGARAKIAWLVTPLGIGGGALTVLHTWAANIDLERFEPSVILGVDGHSKAMRALDLGHLPVYTVPALSFKRGWLLSALVSLIRIIRAERFDIVHTMLVQGDILGVIAAKLIGSGIIVSSVVGSLYRSETPRAKKWIYRLFYRILHTHLDRIVAVSHETRSALIRDFGVAPEKVDVIHLGIDRRVLERGELIPLPSFREPVVGTVAELIPEKGIDDFVDAATLIRAEVPRARFVIAGDGPERENLMRKVEAQGLTGVVEFRGWLPSGLDLFEEVDGFVLPSYEEGLPWVVLEAMACRRPTVATNVGGIPEIITDGENGLLVQAGDPASIAVAVLSLINNPEWALEVGERGRQHVESRFSAYREMSEIEALYDQAMRACRCRK